ncbi:hypothetical protein llap_12793 [Limosa lapponica baueri]|uniref:Uncharacterized protein n=1 Tax=Limosa lapponica baueri TaxID=1758121 RepID=A0A2I0TT32_LIMLA|nr:hypothetical protein llap_12793 [Limosa lapponica baueri]
MEALELGSDSTSQAQKGRSPQDLEIRVATLVLLTSDLSQFPSTNPTISVAIDHLLPVDPSGNKFLEGRLLMATDLERWLSGYEVLQDCKVPDGVDKMSPCVSELLIQKQVSRITSGGNRKQQRNEVN